MKKYILFNFSLIVFFFVVFTTVGYCQIQRQVNYCTITQTIYAIPSCTDKGKITDLDRVKMMRKDLLEYTENVIDYENTLTVTTFFPQAPPEHDYQFNVGKSVTSMYGTTLYDINGEEISVRLDEEPNEIFIFHPDYIEFYGIHNNIFEIGKDVAMHNLRNSGYEVYEDENFVIGKSDRMEIAINFDQLVSETRFFTEEERKLNHLQRTNYKRTHDGYIVPILETEVSYDILPSEIPYQITRVKIYLFYQVVKHGNEIIVTVGEELSHEEYLAYLQNEMLEIYGGGNFFEFDTEEDGTAIESNITIFPNPAEDHITIVFPDNMREDIHVQIFNRFGHSEMETHHPEGEQIVLDIHFLQSDVYILHCRKEDKVISTIFVKQ
jgi:hypothetical protein